MNLQKMLKYTKRDLPTIRGAQYHQAESLDTSISNTTVKILKLTKTLKSLRKYRKALESRHAGFATV